MTDSDSLWRAVAKARAEASDDEVMAAEGVTNLDHNAYVPGETLMPDFFV